MKARWKVAVGLAFVSALCVLLLWRAKNDERTAVEETRRALRQQGFKTDLADFDFSTPPQTWARIGALTNVFPPSVPRSAADYARRSALLDSIPDLQEAVGSNAALVIWRQVRLPGDSGEDQWQTLREVMTDNRADLDAACEAALAGPIRFNLDASAGHGLLLPHLASLKQLTRVLATRAMLELHDGHKDEAWTNLLAAMRLVTVWDPEPVEISHLVRFACTTIAFDVTWQALQKDGWTDDRLTQLQREWESVDFFKGLPEIAAFARASWVTACQLERRQPIPSVPTIKYLMQLAIRSPRDAWANLRYYRRQIDYRDRGTYEDEKALLLHYRDREVEFRRAIQCSTWLEMRRLPGVTNVVFFRSKHDSRMQTMLNVKQIAFASALYAQQPGQAPRTLLSRAAESEARRRLIVTAIALERYRGRNGSYPDTFQELAPELLKDPPTDFMDGKPLRYHRTEDGHFVLYSVGLDCVDNGGLLPQRPPRQLLYVAPRKRIIPPQTDLVWPRPAFDR